MQVRCCFIHVHYGIEYIKLRISLLKSVHIFCQALFRCCCILCSDSCIFPQSYLYYILIEGLLLVGCCQHCLTRRSVKQIFKVAFFLLSVCPFLFCIELCYCSVEQLMICFSDRLLFEDHIILDPVSVYIVCDELSVVVCQRTFSLHMTYTFFHEVAPLYTGCVLAYNQYTRFCYSCQE